MIYSTYVFMCEDCYITAHFINFTDARRKGWAIARDRDHCYCPVCAPRHRHVGRKPKYKKYNE